MRTALRQITSDLDGCIEFYDDSVTKLYYTNYIEVFQFFANGSDAHCFGNLGMVTETWGMTNAEGGKYQQIALGPWCIEWPDMIQHEFYHALGFADEQQRNDRDQSIKLHWDVIEKVHEDHELLMYQILGDRWLENDEPYNIDSIN